MKYYVIYQYVGETGRQRYHVKYDWIRFDSLDAKHALEKFWNYNSDSGTYFHTNREHKKDFKILDVKTFSDTEEESNFRRKYWEEVDPCGFQD